jgi:small-conductance mechanosensitive channel
MEWIIKLMNWELLSLGENSVTIGQLVAALLTVSIALILAAWLIRQLTKRLLDGGKDANVVQLIKKVLWAAVLAILFFTALGMLGVPLGAFAFISGAIAIGIGFGAQNIINNFISGWILMGERPIRRFASATCWRLTARWGVSRRSIPAPRASNEWTGSESLFPTATYWKT